MKVTTNTKELKNALELHKKIVQKVKVDVLNGVRLKANNTQNTIAGNADLEDKFDAAMNTKDNTPDNTLELYSTDLEFSLKSTLNAIVTELGEQNEVLVPLKNFENAIKGTNTQEITLELIEEVKNETYEKEIEPAYWTEAKENENAHWVTAKTEAVTEEVKTYHLKIDNKLSLNTLNLEEFPLWPEVAGKSTVVDRAKFFGTLAKVYDCVCKDDTKNPLWSGYCINTTDNEIVATDSYRLAVAKFPFNKEIIIKDKDWNEACTERIEKPTGNLIVPIKTYDILKKVSGEELKIEVNAEENQIAFTISNVQLVSRLLSGRFPDYQQLMPESQLINFEFEPQDLIKQLVKIEKSLLSGNQEGVPVKLTFETNSIKVECEVKDIGSYEDQIEAVGRVEAPEKTLQMAFNPYLMVSILKQFEGKVKIGIDTELKPVVIKQNEELRYLLMPIRIN